MAIFVNQRGNKMRITKLIVPSLLLGALFSALSASAGVVDTIDSTSGLGRLKF